jgi:hypothetical protein
MKKSSIRSWNRTHSSSLSSRCTDNKSIASLYFEMVIGPVAGDAAPDSAPPKEKHNNKNKPLGALYAAPEQETSNTATINTTEAGPLDTVPITTAETAPPKEKHAPVNTTETAPPKKKPNNKSFTCS